MNISALTRAYAPVAPSSKPASAARNTASSSPDVVVQISAAGRAAAAGVDRVGPWPVDQMGPWGALKADQSGPLVFNQAVRIGPWGV